MSITFCEKDWSIDDLNSLTRRIEFVKEQSDCSLASAMEAIEVLEQIAGIRNKKKYAYRLSSARRKMWQQPW